MVSVADTQFTLMQRSRCSWHSLQSVAELRVKRLESGVSRLASWMVGAATLSPIIARRERKMTSCMLVVGKVNRCRMSAGSVVNVDQGRRVAK